MNYSLIQVLVRIHFSGVNPVDASIREGSRSIGRDPPFISGRDAAGVVETVGEGVTEFKVSIDGYFSVTVLCYLAPCHTCNNVNTYNNTNCAV